MTKKDYIAIGTALKECRGLTGNGYGTTNYEEGVTDAVSHLSHKLATMFKEDNPLFDRARWFDFVGVNDLG